MQGTAQPHQLPAECQNVKPEHNFNFKFQQAQTGKRYSLYCCVPLAHFFSKALCEKSMNSIQFFFLFPIYTIASYLHIHITYLLSVWVPLTNFDFWSLSSGWWRYLHHLRRWWRYLHHLRGRFNRYDFLLTTTQNEAPNQYTLYDSAQSKLNKATSLPQLHSQTC